jgi:hypothetical protein
MYLPMTECEWHYAQFFSLSSGDKYVVSLKRLITKIANKQKNIMTNVNFKDKI